MELIFPHFIISKNLCGMFHAIYQKNLCNKKVKMVGPPKNKKVTSLFFSLYLYLSHTHFTHTHTLTHLQTHHNFKNLKGSAAVLTNPIVWLPHITTQIFHHLANYLSFSFFPLFASFLSFKLHSYSRANPITINFVLNLF